MAKLQTLFLTMKGFYPVLSRVLTKIALLLFSLILLCYLLVWLLSPYVIKQQTAPLLEDFSYRLSENSHLRFNPFTFTLSISDFALQGLDGSDTYVSVSEGHIDLDAFALPKETIALESVILSDATLSVSRAEEILEIAGYKIDLGAPEQEPEPEQTNEEPLAWGLKVNDFRINQLVSAINDNGSAHEVVLTQLDLQNIRLNLDTQRGALDLDAIINDAELSGTIAFDLEDQIGTVESRLSLSGFNPGNLTYLSRGYVSEASANVDLSLDNTLKFVREGLDISFDNIDLSIRELTTTMGAIQVNAPAISAKLPNVHILIEAGVMSLLEASSDIELNSTIAMVDADADTLPFLGEGQQAQGSTSMSLSLNNQLKMQPDTMDIKVNDLNLSLTELSTTLGVLAIKTPAFDVRMPTADIQLESGELAVFDTVSSIQLAQFETGNKATDDMLLSFESLDIETISTRLDDQREPVIAIPTVLFSGLAVSDKASAETALPTLFSSERLDISDIKTGPGFAHIGTIELAPFVANLKLDKQGVRNLVSLELGSTAPTANTGDTGDTGKQTAEKAPQPDDTQTAQIAQAEPAFAFSLGQFKVTGDSELNIEDASVKPAFNEKFRINHIDIGAIDSAQESQRTPFNIAFQADKYSKGTLDGSVAIFSDKVNMDLNATLEEFSLPKISPYVREAAGMDMLSGQFDNKLDLVIVNDEIKGESKLSLRGLEVETATDVKKGSLSEHAFIPLGLALGALKDSDGKIKMDVPLSGNVNDPDFGLNGFIFLVSQKAALSAAESYVINTFVPYANIVSLTRMAGEFALKVRIEDLPYQAGQTEFSEDQDTFIKGFIALMEQKPDIQIKVCPFATINDLPEGEADLNDPESIEKLKQVAAQRSEHFKDYMINEANIASSRLFVCQPKIDGSEKAQARIEFSI